MSATWTVSLTEVKKTASMVRRGDVISYGDGTGDRVRDIRADLIPGYPGRRYTFIAEDGSVIGTAGASGQVPVLVARLRAVEPTTTTEEG